MAPSILFLPLELQRLIVELCSDSPSSLAALARIHTSYKREAEKALYHTLSIFAYSFESLKCMEALATNSEKAALVRFLIIEYTRHDKQKNQRLTKFLSKSLINMHSLSDFRVRSPPDSGAQMKGLGKILCQGHFRLQALYCHGVFDISEIIKSQSELQILGLYSPGNLGSLLHPLKELHNSQLFLPIVLELERESFTPYPDHISIYPTFYSVDRRATIPQVLAQSFCKDQGYYMIAKAANIRTLSIYLVDSSDIPTVYGLAKEMAVTFPGICYLILCFERRCDISPEEIKEKFSFFKLNEVNMYVWPKLRLRMRASTRLAEKRKLLTDEG